MSEKKLPSTFTLILALCLFSFPEGLLQRLPSITGAILLYGGVLMAVRIALYYVKYKTAPSVIIIIEVLFVASLIISTLINHGDLMRVIKMGYKIIAPSILADLYFRFDYKKALGVIGKFGSVLIFLNLIFVILMPSGFFVSSSGDKYTFLNLINNVQIYWIPAMAFCLADCVVNERKSFFLRATLLFVSVFIPSVQYNNETGIVLALALYIAFSAYALKRAIRYKTMFRTSNLAFILAIDIAVVFIFILSNAKTSFITDLFSNYRTLEIRLFLWTSTLKKIVARPFLAYGVLDSDLIIYYNQWRNYSPHNMFLMICIWGGIVALILFFALLLLPLLQKTKKRGQETFCYEICFLAFLVYFLMEVIITMPLFYIFLVAFYYCRKRDREALRDDFKEAIK